MPEGLSGSEVGKEIAEHRAHAAEHRRGGPIRGRRYWLTITEAVLLSVVAVVASYSGYSAAQWSTHSSVELATASADRTRANRADLEGLAQRNFDASTFNAWFTAYLAGNRRGMALAKRRFSPTFLPAFNAWWATHPATNPNSPPGPTYMPQYQLPQASISRIYDEKSDAEFNTGSEAGATSDKYIRVTVYLATVLFLVGMSSQLPVLTARYALISVGLLLIILLGRPTAAAAAAAWLSGFPRPSGAGPLSLSYPQEHASFDSATSAASIRTSRRRCACCSWAAC